MALVYTCTPGNAGEGTATDGLGRTEPFPTCTDGVWVESLELVQGIHEFQLSHVDPEVFAEAFAAGFIILGTAWAIGRSVGVILSMIGGR